MSSLVNSAAHTQAISEYCKDEAQENPLKMTILSGFSTSIVSNTVIQQIQSVILYKTWCKNYYNKPDSVMKFKESRGNLTTSSLKYGNEQVQRLYIDAIDTYSNDRRAL